MRRHFAWRERILGQNGTPGCFEAWKVFAGVVKEDMLGDAHDKMIRHGQPRGMRTVSVFCGLIDDMRLNSHADMRARDARIKSWPIRNT